MTTDEQTFREDAEFSLSSGDESEIILHVTLQLKTGQASNTQNNSRASQLCKIHLNRMAIGDRLVEIDRLAMRTCFERFAKRLAQCGIFLGEALMQTSSGFTCLIVKAECEQLSEILLGIDVGHRRRAYVDSQDTSPTIQEISEDGACDELIRAHLPSVVLSVVEKLKANRGRHLLLSMTERKKENLDQLFIPKLAVITGRLLGLVQKRNTLAPPTGAQQQLREEAKSQDLDEAEIVRRLLVQGNARSTSALQRVGRTSSGRIEDRAAPAHDAGLLLEPTAANPPENETDNMEVYPADDGSDFDGDSFVPVDPMVLEQSFVDCDDGDFSDEDLFPTS